VFSPSFSTSSETGERPAKEKVSLVSLDTSKYTLSESASGARYISSSECMVVEKASNSETLALSNSGFCIVHDEHAICGS